MKKLLVSLGLGVALSSSLFALSGPYAHIFKAEVKENAKYVKYITSKELKKWIDSDKDFTIIDVREPAEWQAGEIDWPDYDEVPRGLADVMAAKGKWKKNNTYVIVCATGGRATLVGGKLAKLYGFKHIYVLKGGMKGWLKAGYSVVNKLGELKAK